MKRKLIARILAPALALALLLCSGALADPDLSIPDTVTYLGDRNAAFTTVLNNNEARILAFETAEYKTWDGPDEIACSPKPVGFADLNGDGSEEMMFLEMNDEEGADLSIWSADQDSGVSCTFFLRNAAMPDIQYLCDMQMYFTADGSVVIEYIDEIGWGFIRLVSDGAGLAVRDIAVREDDNLQNETDRYFRNGQEISKDSYQALIAEWQNSKTALIGAVPQKDKRTIGFDLTLEEALAHLGSTGGSRTGNGNNTETGWTCASCGQAGNTGNFCSNCGTARTAAGEWTCAKCGQAGNTGNFCSNCGTARTANGTGSTAIPPDSSKDDTGSSENGSGKDTSGQTAVNENLEQIPGETDKVKVCLASVTASSYIENKQDPSRWLPSNAADGDESTCWQFSAKKGLKGKSWIQLNIGSAQSVDEVWFKNGFWAVNDQGKDQYGINARPKKIRIDYLYSGEAEFRDAKEYTLKDESRKGWQEFDVGHHSGVTAVRVAIISAYQGSYYKNDVCLSEVMLVQDGPASGAKAAQAEKTATVYESYPWVTGCSLLMKLATRSGPGTEFQEPGTFFGKNWQSTTVKVLKKSWDGSIWWVQVEFDYGNYGKYRVWTGKKRVDVDLDKLEQETSLGSGHVMPTAETYYGPGTNYAKAKMTIDRPAETEVYARENGFVEIEYRYPGSSRKYRVWVREEATYDMVWLPVNPNPNPNPNPDPGRNSISDTPEEERDPRRP